MIIVTIKTDQPIAEVGIFDGMQKLTYETWEAHRTLTDTIHVKIKTLLDATNKEWADIDGVVIFKGPGSFTGLRIGFAVANTLAYTNKASIVATTGERWLVSGIERLLAGEDEHIAIPEYGANPYTTTPKK